MMDKKDSTVNTLRLWQPTAKIKNSKRPISKHQVLASVMV